MIILADLIRYNAHKCSQQISDIKSRALESARKYVYFAHTTTPEGNVMQALRTTTVRHISPFHPEWEKYQALKKQTAIWYTAIHLEKVRNARNLAVEIYDDKQAVANMATLIGEHHNKAEEVAANTLTAARYIKRLDAQMRKRAEQGISYPEVESWKQKIIAENEKRRAERDANIDPAATLAEMEANGASLRASEEELKEVAGGE